MGFTLRVRFREIVELVRAFGPFGVAIDTRISPSHGQHLDRVNQSVNYTRKLNQSFALT